MTNGLGILGLGSKSTIFYVKELNRLYHEIYSNYSTCPFTLVNTNFDRINNLLPNYSAILGDVVSEYLKQLIAHGVDSILIPNITLHETIDKIIDEGNYGVSIIHPLSNTISKLKENDIKEVALFGSYYTMNSGYIPSYFNHNGVQIITPSPSDMKDIDEIRKHVYAEKDIKENATLFDKLVNQYSEEYYIVLACTELSILNSKSNQWIYDMARIQINEAMKILTE